MRKPWTYIYIYIYRSMEETVQALKWLTENVSERSLRPGQGGSVAAHAHGTVHHPSGRNVSQQAPGVDELQFCFSLLLPLA